MTPTTVTTPDSTCWLSLLVPAYNVERHVGECLRSILAQRLAGVEVLVVDDGSIDSTDARIAECRRRHPDRLDADFRTENRGIAATRNQLLQAARGEYIWFIDADDTMRPGAVEALRTVVDRHAPDLVMCDYLRRGRRRLRHGSAFAGPGRTVIDDTSTILVGLFAAGQLHPWSKISRRALWNESLRFPVGRVFEDVAVMPKLASRARTAYHVPEPWIEYRQWSGSIVANMNPTKCLDLVRASADFCTDLRRPGLRLSEDALFAARHYAARHFIRAMRHLERDPEQHVCRPLQGECLALFAQAIDRQFGWLLRRYLQRGWLWRWARLQYWLRKTTLYSVDGHGEASPLAA